MRSKYNITYIHIQYSSLSQKLSEFPVKFSEARELPDFFFDQKKDYGQQLR